MHYQLLFIFILVINVLIIYKRHDKRLTPFAIFLFAIIILVEIISNAYVNVGAIKLSSWTLFASNIGFIFLCFLIMKNRPYFYKDLSGFERKKQFILLSILFIIAILLARYFIAQATGK